jgi:hypothetical protein
MPEKTKVKNIGLTNIDTSMKIDQPLVTTTKTSLDTTKFSPKIRTKPVDLKNVPSDVSAKAASTMQQLPQKLAQMGLQPEDDLEIHGTTSSADVDHKPKIENLPAVISTALQSYDANVHPEWTMVKDLPGYMSGAIRAFGREIMKVLAPGTPLEQIQVITTLGSLNSSKEINAVANFLKSNGIRDENKSGEIVELLSGYSPKVAVFRALGYNWLMVQDFAGKYIYVGEDPNPPMVKNQTNNNKTIANEMRNILDLLK